MKLALLLKSFRDNFLLISISLIAVFIFEICFVLAMKNIAPEMVRFMSRFQFLKQLFQALISLDVSSGASPTTLVVLGLLHPFLSAVTWGTLVTIGTRFPAGEIDRGTADLLLVLPISRSASYVSSTLILAVTSLLLTAATWAGIAIGTRLVTFPEQIDLARIGMASNNQAAILLAISGIAALVSCLVNRRGVAVAIVVGLLLASFLINFLAVFLPVFKTVEFLGILNYYRPVEIVRDKNWPVRNLTILGIIAFGSWISGLLVFRRKDIPVA